MNRSEELWTAISILAMTAADLPTCRLTRSPISISAVMFDRLGQSGVFL